MKHIAKVIEQRAADLKKMMDTPYTPVQSNYKAVTVDPDPYGVVADEISRDHARDNQL